MTTKKRQNVTGPSKDVAIKSFKHSLSSINIMYDEQIIGCTVSCKKIRTRFLFFKTSSEGKINY